MFLDDQNLNYVLCVLHFDCINYSNGEERKEEFHVFITADNSSSSWRAGSVGEHVALQNQGRLLPVDEAEECGSGRGSVQAGTTSPCSDYPESFVRYRWFKY